MKTLTALIMFLASYLAYAQHTVYLPIISKPHPIPQKERDEFRNSSTQTVKVLEMKYFPVTAGGNIDLSVTGGPQSFTLSQMRSRVSSMSINLAGSLSAGTNWYLNYGIVDSKEFLKAAKNLFHKDQFHEAFYSDNRFIFSNDVDICHYVDKLGVRDVWIWIYHNDKVLVPVESNMSMGKVSKDFYNRGSYGDISNSWLLDDLPVCDRTYVVYQFNYYRTVGEAIHNYGHQRERIYRRVMGQDWVNTFESPFGQLTGNACGNVHFPPTAEFGYDYANKRAVGSVCSNWDPTLSGASEQVSCQDWGCTQEGYLTWWSSRIPGFGNSVTYNGKTLRNFHEFFADFDIAAVIGMGPSL